MLLESFERVSADMTGENAKRMPSFEQQITYSISTTFFATFKLLRPFSWRRKSEQLAGCLWALGWLDPGGARSIGGNLRRVFCIPKTEVEPEIILNSLLGGGFPPRSWPFFRPHVERWDGISWKISLRPWQKGVNATAQLQYLTFSSVLLTLCPW